MGITAAQILEMEKADTTIKVEDLSAAVTAHQKTLLVNDNEFISSIKGKGKGEVHDLYARAFKKHGLKPEELVDDKGEPKKPEEIVKLITDKANEGKDKTLQDLQAENIALKAENVKLKDEDIPKIKSEVETEKKKFIIKEKLIKKLTAAGELRNPIEVVEAALGIEFGKNGYTIEEDDKGELVFKKDGLGIKNAAGTAILTADEIITDSLKKNKFIAESNPGDPNKKIVPDPKPGDKKDDPDPSKTTFAPGLGKAEAHLAKMKEKSGAPPA